MSTSNRPLSQLLENRTYLSAGDPDYAFSGDGRASFNFPGAPFLVADSAVTTEGKVIVAGSKSGNMAVARLNANGSVDTSFGTGGLYESTRRPEVTSVAVQGDGMIIMGLGRDSGYEHVDLMVGRLLANGSGFDFDFGEFGIAHAGRERFDSSRINDVAVQRDGKIIGAGSVDTGIVSYDHDFAVVRYDENGALDDTFDDDGLSVHGFVNDLEHISGVTIDYNGNSDSNPLYGTVVAVGGNDGAPGPTQPNRFLIMRLRPNGTLDAGFSGGTLYSPDLSGASIEQAKDVVVQPGGKIVVAGTAASASDPNVKNFLIARYTGAGAIDTSFGLSGGGVTELDLNGGPDEVGAIAIGYHNTVGNLIVAGSTNNKIALVALTPDGELDPRFSGDGILTTNISGHATGLFATGSLFPPARKLVFAGGNGQVARYIDVASLISVGTFQPNMYEQGEVATSFLVTRTVALPFAETIILADAGSATTLGAQRDFNGTDILFGNGQTTSTQVVIPAGETSVTAILKPIDDLLVEGDETIAFTVNTSITYDASPTHSTTLIVRDNEFIAPAVIQSSFNFETYPQKAPITFNQNVQSTFTLGDITVTGPGPNPPAYSLDYSSVTNTGTVVFYNGLTDGNYTVTVRGDGVTVNGVPMAEDYTFGFFFLNGDASHDRTVNFNDLLIVAQNYGQSNRTFSQGNVDYSSDGLVNFNDLLIIAQRYGTSLPSLRAPASFGSTRIGGDVLGLSDGRVIS